MFAPVRSDGFSIPVIYIVQSDVEKTLRVSSSTNDRSLSS